MRFTFGCAALVVTALTLVGCCACDADPCACGGLMCTAPCATNPCGCDLEVPPVGEVPTWADAGLVSSPEQAPAPTETAAEGS